LLSLSLSKALLHKGTRTKKNRPLLLLLLLLSEAELTLLRVVSSRGRRRLQSPNRFSIKMYIVCGGGD
jgi:hypothetical protein